MKHSVIAGVAFSMVFCAFIGCGNRNEGRPASTARKIEEAISANRPGTIATSGSGYMMTATLNGEPWSAASMMPPSASDRIIGYAKDDYIGLPYDSRDMVVGKTEKLGPNNAVDVFVHTAPGGWLTISGQMVIAKADAQWVEGTFACSMKSTDGNGTLEVTKGSFRIPAATAK